MLLSLSLATLCFINSAGVSQCVPALIGKDTKPGSYNVTHRQVLTPGYGGDVLKFAETEREIQAIHRTYLGNPAQKREQRLKSENPKDRLITKGCVNTAPENYDEIVKNLEQNDTLEIIE